MSENIFSGFHLVVIFVPFNVINEEQTNGDRLLSSYVNNVLLVVEVNQEDWRVSNHNLFLFTVPQQPGAKP
jgi:hypothetical protein